MSETILEHYLNRLRTKIANGNTREESFYDTLAALIEKMSHTLKTGIPNIIIMPSQTSDGYPDILLKNIKNLVIGYIEVKSLFKNLENAEKSIQVTRYRKGFPNFILTNCVEFRLYRYGQLYAHVTLAQKNSFQTPGQKIPPAEVKKFTALIGDFLAYSFPVPRGVKELAEELARRTRYMRDHVVLKMLYRTEPPEDSREYHINGLYSAFSTYLIHGLSKKDFADLYSQTITFGLFTAAAQKQTLKDVPYLLPYIPPTNGILRDMFQFISMGNVPETLRACIDNIYAVIAAVKPYEVFNTYYKNGEGVDPVLHFYETFLNQYDPTLREKKGIYYTPAPIVNYIIRSLHIILNKHLNKPDGLADQSVKILDPAAGTATFLAAAAQLAMEFYCEKYGPGTQTSLLRHYFHNNLYGFEEMMAPYAVSHLKLLYLLEKQGLAGEDSPRLNLYLTNTLELENIELSDLPGISSLSKEARLAGKIKKDTPITVILGNPPYSGHSANRSVIPQTSSKKTGQTGSFTSKERTWIGSQIEHYKRIDGIPLQEKNLKWLQDDYVKFIRFAQYMIDRNPAGEGVIGYITNHSYLDNPTFRGMRQSLMTSFNYIYILNLHGNIAKKEKCPDGTVDENLFHIRQGTAIAFFIKKKNHPEPCQVFYGQIQGSRLYKQQLLNSQNIDTTPWQPIQPRAPFYLFTPGENMNQDHYASFFRVNDIFPVHSVAIITARDALTIAPNPDELLQRITQFANLDENTARHTFQLEEDSRDWQIKDAQADLHESGLSPSHITPFLYRPFDIRYTYYTGRSRGFLCMPRPEVMRHMLQENIALITVRQVAEGTFNHCLVTNTITESRITTSNKGIAYLFPLYLYLYPHHHPKRGKNNLFSYLNQNNNQPQPRQPNLSPFILHWWSQTAHFPGEPNPEELFYYVYAILFSNLYRQTYAQGLKMDFPRVPFTTQYPLFCKLSQLGHQLVNLHLLKAPQLNNTSIKFPLPGTNQIKYIQYFPEMQKLLINEQQYFSPIHSTTWEYHLCGYQVLNKWLKDRKKQKLTGSDILHFIKITTIIQLTIQIQNDIDLLYQELEPENFS